MLACDDSGNRSSGRWVEALGLLDLMDHYGAVPDVVTFGAAISACAKGGQWQKALTLLDVAQVDYI